MHSNYPVEIEPNKPRGDTGIPPGNRKRLAALRRDGPGPYTRASMPQGANREQHQRHLHSFAIPFGFNREQRRKAAWEERTRQGRKERIIRQQLEAQRRLSIDLKEAK